MHLAALRSIGETIASEEFVDSFDRFYTAAAIEDVQAVVVIQLRETEPDGPLTYDKTYVRSAEDPVDMAHTYAYAHNKRTDKSLTQKTVGNPEKDTRNVLEWPNRDELGDAADDPVIDRLREAFAAHGETIVDDALGHFATENAPEGLDADDDPVLITVELVGADGEARFPGAIPEVREGIRAYHRTKLADSSYATGATGVAACLVCGAETDVFGGSAGFDGLYTLLKQGNFGIETHNASESWRSRPLCVDCITAIETATDRFLDPQRYGVAGVRCRVIPYALPTADSEEQLTRLIRGAREDLLGTESFPDRGEDERYDRPLKTAWDAHLADADILGADDTLRLAIIHYRKDQSRSIPLAWIDGVSVPAVTQIEETAAEIVERPAYLAAVQPGDPKETGNYVAPTERQIWTGAWLYDVLARVSSRSGTDRAPGDKPVWLTVTHALLAGEAIDQGPLSAAIVDEMLARRRDDHEYESDAADQWYGSPFDAVHAARVYCVLETLAALGLTGLDRDAKAGDHDQERPITETMLDRNTETETSSDTNTTADGEELRFPSLGAAVEAFIAEHETIRSSPGRTAAFGVGVLAAGLSSWQQTRDLNRTYLSNVRLDTVSTESLPRMKSRIWDKANIYHAQRGRSGTPWSDLHVLIDQAILEGKSDGWQATRDDIQAFFVMGTTIGPRLRSHVENSASEPESDPEDADGEPAAPSTDGQQHEQSTLD